MLSQSEVTAAIGSTAYGNGGDKLGTVQHFFVDDRTGEPTWVAVTTGLFGTRHSIVPASEASWHDGRLQLPVTADAVRSAPAPSGNHLDPGEEAELRRHYGLAEAVSSAPVEGGNTGSATDTVALPATPPVPEPDRAGRAAPASTDGAMTRSEERLAVSTERVPVRRVRVVKYVVTEEVQVTVPIRREEIRIEEVPLDAEDGTALDTARSSSLPEEIVLHTERPVVSVEVVPVERVRLRTELVTEQETVTGQVRREQVVVDHDPVTPDDAV